MVPGHADRKPSSHRMPDKVGALAAEIVDQGDDVVGSLPLIVEPGIGRLVALAMAQRVDAGDAESVGQRGDDPGLLPALGVQEQPML
jgi:hypothetical protein